MTEEPTPPGLYLEPVHKFGQIKEGDLLLIYDKEFGIRSMTCKEVINTKDDEEILLVKKSNVYFIMSLYLKGRSWAEHVYIVKKSSGDTDD